MIAVRVNETDTFADEDGANDEYFDFEDISGRRQSQSVSHSRQEFDVFLPKTACLCEDCCAAEKADGIALVMCRDLSGGSWEKRKAA